jgi:hypothetical protein
MASEYTLTASTREEIAHCLQRASEERAAARKAAEVCARDAHAMLAERFARRAHALAGELPDPALPGGVLAGRH